MVIILTNTREAKHLLQKHTDGSYLVVIPVGWIISWQAYRGMPLVLRKQSPFITIEKRPVKDLDANTSVRLLQKWKEWMVIFPIQWVREFHWYEGMPLHLLWQDGLITITGDFSRVI